jgi:hypothetical protein
MQLFSGSHLLFACITDTEKLLALGSSREMHFFTRYLDLVRFPLHSARRNISIAVSLSLLRCTHPETLRFALQVETADSYYLALEIDDYRTLDPLAPARKNRTGRT